MNQTPPNPNNPNQAYERIIEKALLAAYQEQQRSRVWKNIWRLIFIVLILIITLASLRACDSSSETTAATTTTKEHVAVIRLYGELSDNEYSNPTDRLLESLEAAYRNPAVQAIVIRANSPGGSPVLANTAFDEIRRLREKHSHIPVYTMVEDICASGCYYIAAATDKIYADPASIVGSIGVIGSSFDATELMNKIGIKRRVRTAGSNKGMGDPFTAETTEQQAIWQEMLDQIHQQFIQAVQTGRGERLQNHPDIFSGRVYTGQEAKKLGLIDDTANLYSLTRDIIQTSEMVDYTTTEKDWMRLLNKQIGLNILQTLLPYNHPIR